MAYCERQLLGKAVVQPNSISMSKNGGQLATDKEMPKMESVDALIRKHIKPYQLLG